MGTGITKVSFPGREPFLLRVSDGIITDYKSIVSSNQLRHFGCKVEDTPCQYNGRQALWTPDNTYIPLMYKQALCYVACYKPTPQDLENLPVHDITASDGSWKPNKETASMIWYHDDKTGTSLNDYDTWDEVKNKHADKKASFRKRKQNKITTKVGSFDAEHVQRCLGWKPLDVIKKTLKATTQLAENHVRLPMRVHFKSRSPALNVRRLREVFATDTFFSSEKALGGYTMAQLYIDKTSTFTEIFGMKRKSQMSETPQDFIRQWGAPSGLMLDSAKIETSKAVKDILRMYGIKDMQSEANHQHQNYAEQHIQEVKCTSNIVMDRINALGVSCTNSPPAVTCSSISLA